MMPALPLSPYQKILLDQLTANPGYVWAFASRGSGKSMMTQLKSRNCTAFSIVDRGFVDGQPWYTIKCSSDIAAWVRKQPEESWAQHPAVSVVSSLFDVSDRLYSMMALKWS
jgi:hypothetical protein